MPTRRENTTLKMPRLLNTNELHDCRTQTPSTEEEDDAHGGNATRRTSTVGQAFLKPATTSCKQNERKKNAAEVRSGVRKETKTTPRQQRRRENGERSRGRRRPTREGRRERDEPFFF